MSADQPSASAARVMRRPDLTRSYLASCVLQKWDAAFSRPANDAVDRRQAQIAVDEVLDALRANPAWLKGLGIGDGC